MQKMIIYLFQLVIPLYVPLRPLKRSRSHIKVKVTHQGQGQHQGQHQIEVIFKERYSYAGGLHLNQMRSCYFCIEY